MADTRRHQSREANAVLMGVALVLLVAAVVLIFLVGSWLGVVALVALLPLVLISTRQKVDGQDDPYV